MHQKKEAGRSDNRNWGINKRTGNAPPVSLRSERRSRGPRRAAKPPVHFMKERPTVANTVGVPGMRRGGLPDSFQLPVKTSPNHTSRRADQGAHQHGTKKKRICSTEDPKKTRASKTKEESGSIRNVSTEDRGIGTNVPR